MENELSVTRLTEAHLADVAELERLCFAEPWSVNALTYLLSSAALGVVCVLEGKAIAYGGMTLAPFEGQVTNIAVHPAHRRRGYGAAIVGELIRRAREASCEQISLEVRASNRGAIALYEGLGFETVGRRKNFYRSPVEDALVMVKNLLDGSN